MLLSVFSNFLFFSSVIIGALSKLKEDYGIFLEESTDVNIFYSHDSKILIVSIRDCMDEQMFTALVKIVVNYTPQDMFNELLLYYLESSAQKFVVTRLFLPWHSALK